MIIVSPRQYHMLRRIESGVSPDDAAREWDIAEAIVQAFSAFYPTFAEGFKELMDQ